MITDGEGGSGSAGACSAKRAVAGFLESLLAHAGREIDEGRLTLTKPRDLLDAAKMLLELDGDATGGTDEDSIARDIIERLREELEGDDGQTR
jgi:hypothetical protein